ncbi:hypothetical protein [Pseudomonas multiresinivorans]|uniref:Uncharacterized protein n=1 Tax=Pseudomonas multiresinivorans TaxID=95301 RepID=A0A7Z3GPQ9_9PSED|nr:hypothetical protein [Pseudomonas multiresinivorans]QJP08268.1 hypothetical protein G4G71_10400 [Pseudomonas multiresinivorans]
MKRNIQYTDLKKAAKQYNNIFENHLNKRSFKSKKFWLSIVFAALMSLCFYADFLLLKNGHFLLSLIPLILLYIFEAIGLAFKTAHDEEQVTEKVRRAKLPPPDEKGLILDDSECRRAWLAREFSVPASSYPLLATEFEKIEEQISRQEKLLSGLDTRFLRHIVKAPKLLILFLLPIMGGLLTFAGQSLITSSGPFNFSELSNMKSLNFIALTACIAVGGLFILSFFLSLLVSLGSFVLDTVSLHGCSAKSRARFKRDLYIYSELPPELESSDMKSPSTARYLHREAL